MGDRRFKGPWGIPDRKDGVCDVESAAHGLVTFKNGATLFLRTSWAEMNKREEVSVTFQGRKAGGLVRRLFGTDGLDETAEDTCELYIQDAKGRRADKTLKVKPDEAMGRVRAATNFVRAVEGREKPLNTPEQANYMIFPRICALAESVWTAQEHKDWKKFQNKVEMHTAFRK